MGLGEILHLRFANTLLEPVWNRNHLVLGADHDGRGLRRRGPRALLRPGRRAARRRRQPPDAGRRRGRDGGAGRAATWRRSRTRWRRSSGRCRRPTRPTTCAASTTATATSTGSRTTPPPRPTRRCKLEIENWRWSGVPFFIRTGKLLPVTQTELRLVFQRSPRLGFFEHYAPGAEPAGDQARPDRPACACCSTRIARTPTSRSRSTSTWSSRTRAARAPRPTRCCCTPR